MPTEDKQNRKSDVQPQTLTPNSSLTQPYEPQLILPPSPILVRPISSPPKQVVVKSKNFITKPKVNLCDFHQHRDRLKPFVKQENSVNGSRPVYTIKERKGELLILFSNGQWLSPYPIRVTHEGRYFYHLLFLTSSYMLVETEIDIYQEYVPTNISQKVIIKEWKENISQHFEYLPQVFFQSGKYRKFKSHIPFKIDSHLYWAKVRARTMTSTVRTITLPNLLLLQGMNAGKMSLNETDPFLSLHNIYHTDEFSPKCLW